jgi:hypothetical protein
VTVNFEDSFDAELRTEQGDLGPASVRRERDDRDDNAGDRGDRRGGRRRHR